MPDSISIKEYWNEWFEMEQTQSVLSKINSLRNEILESSLNQERGDRDGRIDNTIGIDMVIELIKSLKEAE